ncbi:MAG: dihydropteroate synthase [Candidatus Omnitrophica bacterium]|nr:dihydropteroate synthase [Candidatus Omnitrophota bacterium]MCM8792989.1 dihydropteroate synthase [Candidatus Omnitrophota bacterium]
MKLRLLKFTGEDDFLEKMRLMRVDKSGQRIMSGKGIFYALQIEGLEALLGNVLKQEMLSLGGEVVLPREVITGKLKKSDCILLGTLSHYRRLIDKLKLQPWGLKKLGEEINTALENIQRKAWKIQAGDYLLDLGKRTYLMGILNVTPDSFSDGGKFYNKPGEALSHALRMEEEGADIIDIGGESTRPGARPVSEDEELRRVIPVIKILNKRLKIPISIDTRKARVAKEAIEAGASMVNDVSGLRYDPEMKKVLAKYSLPVVIMHMKGTPETMQKKPEYKNLISEIIDYFKKSIKLAKDAGIREGEIIIDPGIGFGKTVEHNLIILKNLYQFKILGYPILVGTSRKSFIGKVLNLDVDKRLPGTIASCVLAILNGANLLRVHDIKEVKQAVKLIEAIIKVKDV